MLVIGTRFFDKKEDTTPDKILRFAERALGCADAVFIAINQKQDKSGALQTLMKIEDPRVLAIPVEPWGFTFAMNALVDAATRFGSTYLLSQSVEIDPSKNICNALMAQMDDRTLCAGARLSGHVFMPGTVLARGRTIPWNTCKILNLQYYQVYGFPLIGDAAFDHEQAGVEELIADSLAQHMLSKQGKLSIKLIQIPDISWKTGFENDPERLAAHEQKMKTKDERPAVQMEFSGLPNASVIHIE